METDELKAAPPKKWMRAIHHTQGSLAAIRKWPNRNPLRSSTRMSRWMRSRAISFCL